MPLASGATDLEARGPAERGGGGTQARRAGIHSCSSMANWRAFACSPASHASPVRLVRLSAYGARGRSRPTMDYRTESLDRESTERSRFLASDDRVCSIVLDSGSRLTFKRSLDDPPSVIPTVRLTCHTWVPPAL